MLGPLNKTFLGGAYPTLGRRRGVQRQKLGGLPVFANSGSGTFTATKLVRVLIYAWGGGGGGDSGSLIGLGGAAFYHEAILKPGQQISWSVGPGGAANSGSGATAGGATTVTLPDGRVLTADGGAQGPASTVATATGALVNRPGPVRTAADAGAAAGFADHATDLAGGAAPTGGSPAGQAPGGGGWASLSGAGAPGRLILIPFRLS